MKRVLVVDDSAVSRAVLATMLRDIEGLEVVHAVDGADASRKLAGIDLLITDLMMPGLDGRELVAIVRARVGAAHLPVVVLTTRNQAATAATAGADACITKPIDRAQLLAAVRRLLIT